LVWKSVLFQLHGIDPNRSGTVYALGDFFNLSKQPIEAATYKAS